MPPGSPPVHRAASAPVRHLASLLAAAAFLSSTGTSPAAESPAASTRGTEGTRPLPPAESLATLRTPPGLEVQLVAAEPLLDSPVAIDWGADGRLWVCEMRDYPTGLDEHWKPGGQIKVLRDTDGDGRPDQATVFLDGLPFPTGVTAWKKGALVCAAPDILYAEDTDGDGRADKVEKWFSGFYTDNYQARVNSLSLGLDNWVYGANGLLGGVIRGTAAGTRVDIRNRDFRFRPGTGAFEPASGLTQQSRVRDDWGNWFGCDNSRALLHFPLPDHYLKRNPHVTAPEPIVLVPRYPGAGQLFPASQTLERFNDPHAANRVTSGCGLGLYRDSWLGAQFQDNAFVCEPVHNLVHREVLSATNLTFTSQRAAGESASEFLASTDHWFRPVQARTGPDGALYVVDMYRFLIEHPRWIAAARLARIDVRAGAGMGRLYRVVPRGETPRPVRDLTRLSTVALAEALDSPSGTERDRVHLELHHRADPAAAPALRPLARQSPRPQVRAQAWCALEGMGQLQAEDVLAALGDLHPGVRRQAIRLAEPFLQSARRPESGRILDALVKLVADPDPFLRAQLAFSLGESRDPQAGDALGRLAVLGLDESRQRAAVLSSATAHVRPVLAAVLGTPSATRKRTDWIVPLLQTAVAGDDDAVISETLEWGLPAEGKGAGAGDAVLAGLLNALDARQLDLAAFLDRTARRRALSPRVEHALADARRRAESTQTNPRERTQAVALLGHWPPTLDADLRLLCDLMASPEASLRQAAAAALRRQSRPNLGRTLLDAWSRLSPAPRAEILDLLLSRPAWTLALLEALEQHQVQPGEIAPATRDRLLRQADAGLQPRVQAALRAAPTPERGQALAAFADALKLPGDSRRGSEVFTRLCATCHARDGQGHAVGPDLAPLRDKEPDYWLKNILDPNAALEPRYVNYLVETRDGRSLSGVIRSESATGLTLVGAGGVTESVSHDQVGSIRAAALSLMPEGLEAGLAPQAMADLIAYLKAPPAK